MTDMINLIANFSKILADPVKLRIIKLLKENNRTSKEIQEILDLSQSYASTQLKKLKDKGIIEFNKEGKNKRYNIADQKILAIISEIGDFVIKREKERLSKIARFEASGF